MADTLSMTPDRIANADGTGMIHDPEFLALPYERQRELTDRALSEAGQYVAGDWDKDTYQAWGKFTAKVNAAVTERQPMLDRAMSAVGGAAADVGNLVTGLAKDAGTALMGAGELVHPAGWKAGLPVDSTLAAGFSKGLNQLGASASQFMAPMGGAGSVDQGHVLTQMEKLKAELDTGEFPMSDRTQFAEWLGQHDDAMMAPRAQWFATVRFGGMPGATPKIYEDRHTQNNGLSRPDNAALISSYMLTRDPKAWKQLQDNLLETPDVAQAKGEVQDVLKTPGAQMFEKAFGPGASEHLLSTSNPVTLAGFAIPALRGASAVGKVTGAMAAKEAAAIAGRQVLHSAPEMAGIGAVAAIDQNPNATAGDIVNEAAHMAVTGGLLTAGLGAAGYGLKRGFSDRPIDSPAPGAAGAAGSGTTPAGPAGPTPPPEATPAGTTGPSAQPGQGPPSSGYQGNGSARSSGEGSMAVNPPRQFIVNGQPVVMDSPTPRLPYEALQPPEQRSISTSVNSPPAPAPIVAAETGVNGPERAPSNKTGQAAIDAGSTPATGANRPTAEKSSVVPPETDLFGNPIEQPGLENALKGVQTQEVPLNELKLSRDVPQFKAGADATGIVEPLAGKYERMGTAPILVWERANGQREVISGRHRFDLAKRTGEKSIPAQVVREVDGFSQKHALTADAEINIRDGQGAVRDYANYFRNAGIDAAEAEARGLVGRAKGRDGWTIGTQAGESLFDLHVNEKLTDAQAVALAKAAPRDDGLQRVGIKAMLDDGASIDLAANLIRAVRSEMGGAPDAAQMDLFGRDDRAMQDMTKMAKAATIVQRGLREQVAAVKGAVRKPEAARKMGLDVNDPESIRTKMQDIQTALNRWENWPLHDDLRAQVRAEAGLAPKVATPSPVAAETAQPAFGLESATPEQLAAEQQAQRQRDVLRERSQAPLQGTAGEMGTADMFDTTAGEVPLFDQPMKSAERIREDSPSPAMATLRAANDALLPAAQKAWTEDVYKKAEQFFQSGDETALQGLNPIQKRRIMGVRIENDSALRAAERAQEKAVIRQQREDAVFTRKTTDPSRLRADEELSRKQAYQETAFERAQRGDESAFADMEAAFRERYGYGEPASSAQELSKTQGPVYTAAGFERVFEEAWQAKDFDGFLEALKQSDRAVWAPLVKKFFQTQDVDPVSAVKAEWFRDAMRGTRPASAVAAASSPPPSASPPPPRATPPPPPRATTPPPPPPSAATPPPPRATTPPPPPPSAAAPPRIPVAPITGRLAKSPFKIIEDYAKAIDKHLRVRALKKSQLGVYRPGSTMTAVKFAGDLDTAAHELAGHWTDDKHGLGKPWMKAATSPYDAELAGFWIHGSPSTNKMIQRAEGIAEFFRAYVMDPVTTMKQAPKFAAYVEKTLPKPAMDALNTFSDDVRAWAGENPLRRNGLNIRMDPPSTKERLSAAVFGDGREFNKTAMDKLAARFSDNYHFAVKGFETAVKMTGRTLKHLKPSENFETMVRWLSGYEARFSEQLENGLTPLKTTQAPNAQGKLEVQRVMDPVTNQPMNLPWLLEAFDNTTEAAQKQDMRDVSAMMVSERTLERARQIDAEAAAQITPTTSARARAAILGAAEAAKRKISGLGAGMMSDVQAANEALASLSADPNKAKRLGEAARRYRAWANANLELMVESGRMTREAVDKIKAENTQYVDMHRLSEEFEIEGLVAQSKGGSLGSAKDLLKRFKGSTLEIDNVYASLLKQTEAIQKEVARNRTMQTFVQQLENARGLYDGAPVELDRIGSRATAEDRNTITVYRNGKPEYWKLDQDIHAAVKGFGELGSNEIMDAIGKITGVIRYVITRSPGFAIRNPIRDTVSRSVVSESGGRPWDILNGYTAADKSRLVAFGGGMFGHYGKDRYAWNSELKRGLKEIRKDPRNILMTPMELWKGWEKLMESSEAVGRVAEFRNAYEKGVKELGYSPDEAALYAAGEARGLMDFAKMGTWMRQINKVIPFSNAAVRGLARSASGAMKDPVGFGMRWALFVAVPTLAVRMLAKQMGSDVEEEYQQLPAWQRDFFWNVKVGSYWLRIPKPYELGVMAGGTERALSREMGEKNSFDGYGGSVSKALLPVGDIPSALGPLKAPAEIIFNRDSFRDRDIVPIWERDLKLELRKGATHASMVGQSVGKMMGVDPRNIDHLLGSFGGLGSSVVDFAKPERKMGDAAVKMTGLVLPPISSQSKDYQWVSDWAKANGKLTDKHIKALHDLAMQVYQAESPQQADQLARLVRKQATALRAELQGQ